MTQVIFDYFVLCIVFTYFALYINFTAVSHTVKIFWITLKSKYLV